MIRKIIPGMIANDICGVQPMTGPTGLIFSLRAKFGRNELERFVDEMLTGVPTPATKELGDYLLDDKPAKFN